MPVLERSQGALDTSSSAPPTHRPCSRWRPAMRTRLPAVPHGCGRQACQRTRRTLPRRCTVLSAGLCQSQTFMRWVPADIWSTVGLVSVLLATLVCAFDRGPALWQEEYYISPGTVLWSHCGIVPMSAGHCRFLPRQPAGATAWICWLAHVVLAASSPASFSRPPGLSVFNGWTRALSHASSRASLLVSPCAPQLLSSPCPLNCSSARCCAPPGCAAAPPAWQTCACGSSERPLGVVGCLQGLRPVCCCHPSGHGVDGFTRESLAACRQTSIS